MDSFWAFWARRRPQSRNTNSCNLTLAIVVTILLAAGSIPLLVTLGSSGHWTHSNTSRPLREHAKELWWHLVGPLYDWRWSRVEAAKQALPKYVLPPGLNGTLPVHVIVIPRLTQRLADARQRLAEVGVAYELLNGTDGRQPIPAPLLDMYLGPRLRDLVLRQHDQHWVMMTANLLSNVQAFHRVVAREQQAAVILEDDACPRPNNASWMAEVIKALQQLPEDWDILYLWAQGGQRGRFVGPNVRVVRKAAGTVCYVLSLKGALQAIRLAEHANEGIDKVLFYHEWRHHLQAYVTEPPLCSHGPSGDGAGSTLEYDRGGSVAAVVGRLLRRARSLVAPLLGQESLEGNRHGHGGLWKRGSRKSDPGLDALRGSEARGA
ncbi:hypothetical protein CHLRE_03g166550v5 [Chlamydomonas reinhardtii]|uniref:Uncharacterized protein n=1 Tax=Chlamydomonas reinhardtii TaxID=3055 RepID=A0A2K3DWR7_CHLRE|nr:uncharacterized protein CHLRE_03g166550v5 [Chlamydomonas reinhardtii]PNW84977.1 hypothetical protein CHLRE_03g166550v5 [Chlamydomonas reinhardtii]